MKKITAVVALLAIASLWNLNATQSDAIGSSASTTSEVLSTTAVPFTVDSGSETSSPSGIDTTSDATSLQVGTDSAGSGSGIVDGSHSSDRGHTDPPNKDRSPIIAGVVSAVLILLMVLGCAVCLCCCWCHLARRGSNFSMWRHQKEGKVNEYYYETLSRHLQLTFRRGFESSGVYATVGPPEERESSLDFSSGDSRWLRTPSDSTESAATKATLDRPKRSNIYETPKFASLNNRLCPRNNWLEPNNRVANGRGHLEASNAYETPMDAQRENCVRCKVSGCPGVPVDEVQQCGCGQDVVAVEDGCGLQARDGCGLQDRNGCGLQAKGEGHGLHDEGDGHDLEDEGDGCGLQDKGDKRNGEGGGGQLEREAELGQEGVTQDGTGCSGVTDTQESGAVAIRMDPTRPADEDDDYITMASVKSYLTATT